MIATSIRETAAALVGLLRDYGPQLGADHAAAVESAFAAASTIHEATRRLADEYRHDALAAVVASGLEMAHPIEDEVS